MQQAIFSPFVFLAPRPAEKNRFNQSTNNGSLHQTRKTAHDGAQASGVGHVVRDEHRHTTTQDGLTRATPALAASRIASTPTTIAIIIIG